MVLPHFSLHNSKCVFSTSAVAAALLSVLTVPSCSAFLTPRSLTPSSCSSSRKQSHHYFLPRSGKWQLHQSTVNGEAPAAADASDSDAATSDKVDPHAPTFSTTQKQRQDRSSTYLGLVLFDRDGSDSGRRQKQTTLLYKK